MQLQLHFYVLLLHFAELLGQQQVGLPLVLVGLVDDLLEHHDLSLQIEELVPEPLPGAFLAGVAQQVDQHSDYLAALRGLVGELEHCLLVQLRKRLRLLELHSQLAVLFYQVLIVQAAVVVHLNHLLYIRG